MLRVMLPWLPFETTDGQLSPGGVRAAAPGGALHPERRGVPAGRADRRRAGRRGGQRRLHLRRRAGGGAAVGAAGHGGRGAGRGHGDRASGRGGPGGGAGAVRLPDGRAGPARPAGLRRGAAGVPSGVGARAASGRPVGAARAGAGGRRGAGGRLWAGILGSLRGTAPRARLVLNHLNPLVRRVGRTDRPGADRHGGRGAVRAGAAAGPPPAAAGRFGVGQPGVRRAAHWATLGEGEGR